MERVGPEQALSTSAKVIIEHLRYIAGISEESLAAIAMEEEEGSRLDQRDDRNTDRKPGSVGASLQFAQADRHHHRR